MSNEPPAPRRVLVVDDDPVVRGIVHGLLRADGHEVVQADTGEAALAAIEEQPPDLLVLDIELPEMSGLEVLLRLRHQPAFPVIMMTGHGAESDRVLGLDLGADDYVVKPFLPREFAARVRAVLRRTELVRPEPPASGTNGEEVRAGAVRVEVRALEREVRVDGAAVELTAREFDVLAYLAARPRQAVSRSELLEAVWASSEDWQDPATVTEHVRRIRRKIEDDPDEPRHLRTVRGIGYRFDP